MQGYLQEGKLGIVSVPLFVIAEHTPRRPLRVLGVPAVVFANSPQQNLPIGCPGLARLPNSISFLWESDGLASWYSDRQKERQKTSRRQRETPANAGAQKSTAMRMMKSLTQSTTAEI